MIYNKIRQLCADKGISTREIERACGLGFRSIENWKDHSPSVANVKAVADYLGVTVDELLKD